MFLIFAYLSYDKVGDAMSDIEEVKRRIRKRKGKEVHQTLNDRHFKRVYNVMIKSMVVLLVGLSLVTYFKINPSSNIKTYILNDATFKSFTTWASNTFLSFLPEQDLPVSSEVTYQHLEDDYYTNNSNEVVNMKKGKVIYTGNQEMVGAYVVVLFDNDVQVTYSGMQEVFVDLYDTVEQGMVLGTYDQKLILLFEYLGKDIDYDTFMGME